MGKASKRKRPRGDAPSRRGPSSSSSAPESASTSGSAPDSPAAKRRSRFVAPASAALAVALYLVLKCYALHPHRSDEGIYFYDAVRLASGARLYRDLFFAHPPLHLALPTLLVRVFGYSFFLLKALPQLAGAAQGVLAFFVARRALASDVAAAVAPWALLFADDFLKSTCFATGINVADALVFGAVLAALHRRHALAGVLAAASVMTLLQTAPVALALGAALYFADGGGRRAALRYGAAFAALIALVHAGYALSAGGAFFEQVYAYHLRKSGAEGAGAQQLGFVLADNVALFGGALAGVVIAALARAANERQSNERRSNERQSNERQSNERNARRFVLACAVAVLAQIIAMATRPTVFPFYFQPCFLPAALMLAFAVGAGASRWRAARTSSERAMAAAPIVAAVVLPSLLAAPLTALVSPTRARQRETYTQSYAWKDAPLVGPLNALVRALAWRGGEREPGARPLGATEYLWNQSRGFDAYDAIVDEVRRATPPDATLFGDSASTPLVALGAGRRLAADFADTNVQRFSSGTTTVESTIAEVEAHGPPAMVLASGSAGLFALDGFQHWLAEHYGAWRTFKDSDGNPYTLYRRR